MTRWMRAAAWLAAVAAPACTDDTVQVAPVFELPTADEDAMPVGLDGLVLSVAHAGDDQDLASQSFAPGERVVLTTVPFANDLVVHLTGQIGGSPVAYGRTCAFAVTPDGAPPAPRLWFARNVKFATLSIEPLVRTRGVAIEVPEGALVLGGDGASAGALEWFDPRLNRLTEIASLAPRTGAFAAGIGSGSAGRIAIIGGALPTGGPAGVLELVALVDHAAPGEEARIDRIDDERLARTDATATTLTDGRVVVIGGRLAGHVESSQLILISTGAAGTEIATTRATLAHRRAEHTATRLGDDVGAPVLVAGGIDGDQLVAIAELWKPLSGSFATIAPAMIHPRRRHRAELMPDGSVLMIGGVDATGAAVRTLERFTIDEGFEEVGELPPSAGVVELTTTRLPDGRILIAGGRGALGEPAVDTAMIARLDVVDGSVDVVQTDRLAVPRAGHHAALLCDGTVLVGGGTPAASPAERYNPPPLGRR
ncbi:MAG: hypothetical protein ACTHU0_29895 [Kofleriaceae bacterium]